jgi:perosamine synthetase
VKERHIPVCTPLLGEAEARNVNDAMAQGAISGFFGDYLPAFEEGFAEFCECPYGVAVSSGTTALHLALATLKIGPGDEVLVSTLTNMATFFAILYQGAVPVPIDIEADTWNLDPGLLEARVTSRTKAIMVVHLFGHPVDMDPVMDLARHHRLVVIEDAAEAHGALYKGRKVGGIGDIGCFSFYANKILTTGEGGMLTLKDEQLADRARSLKSLAFGKTNKFMHADLGYNYRMTNLQAAIGCAQLERVDDIIERKRTMANRYTELLRGEELLQLPVEKPYARNVYWMYHVALRGAAASRRAEVRLALAARGIETREAFIPANQQEIFQGQGWAKPADCPKANLAGATGFYLPSGPTLTTSDQEYVAVNLSEVLSEEASSHASSL